MLRAAAGTTLVVDTGPDPAAMATCLRDLGVHDVAALVLTHMHLDHIGGLGGVLGHWPVGTVIVSGYGDQQALEGVTRAAAAVGVPMTNVAPSEVLDVGALHITVLAPSHAFSGTRSDENNDSIVLRVVVDGGFTALLTGDAEPEAQRALLDAGVDVRADVLKVPHHGSDHQDADFLRATGARFGAASLGAGNTYGHPSPRTIQELHDEGLRTFRTDQDGSVAFAGTAGGLTAVGRHGIGTVGVAVDGATAAAPPRVGLIADPECPAEPVAALMPVGPPVPSVAGPPSRTRTAARGPPDQGGAGRRGCGPCVEVALRPAESGSARTARLSRPGARRGVRHPAPARRARCAAWRRTRPHTATRR